MALTQGVSHTVSRAYCVRVWWCVGRHWGGGIACGFGTRQTVPTVFLLLPPTIAYGVNGPNVTALISDLAGRDSQGEALGIDRAMSALAFGLPPILSGWAIGVHVSMPMIFAAVFIFCAWGVFVRFRPYGRRPMFHEVS